MEPTAPLATAPTTLQQQRSTATLARRHVDLLEALRDAARPALQGAPRILSFGCSEGYECLDIHDVFPRARIYGCDIDARALAAARVRCAGRATIFESTEEQLKTLGPFDVILAFNVLCLYPKSAGLDDITPVYPFATYEAGVALLDQHLRPGGLLGITNSPYFFEHSAVASRYVPAPGVVTTRNGWIEKCLPSGRRVTEVLVAYRGRSYNRSEWTAYIAQPEIRAMNLTEIDTRYEHVRIPGAPAPGDLVTVYWEKRV